MIKSTRNNKLSKHLDVMQKLFWMSNEINYSLDKDVFNGLDRDLQHAIIGVVNFFVNADKLVNENIESKILQHTNGSDKYIDAGYNYIKAIESIHLQSYSDYANEVLPPVISEQILAGTYPMTSRLLEYSNMLYEKYAGNLCMLLVSQIIIEGIFFSGAWLLVFWIKKYKSELSSFTKANERINKDESTHITWSHLLIDYFSMSPNRLEVEILIREAVDVAIKVYEEDVMPNDLDSLKREMFAHHLKYVANQQLGCLGFQPIYDVKKTFDFMKTIDYGMRITDFFTSSALDYNKGVTCSGNLNDVTVIDFDQI